MDAADVADEEPAVPLRAAAGASPPPQPLSPQPEDEVSASHSQPYDPVLFERAQLQGLVLVRGDVVRWRAGMPV